MSLLLFIHWCLKGTLPVLMVAAVASVLLGAVETYIAALIGYIIDILIETEASLLFAKHWALILTFSVL